MSARQEHGPCGTDGALPDGPICPVCKWPRFTIAQRGQPWFHSANPVVSIERLEAARKHRNELNRSRIAVEAAAAERDGR